MGFASDDYGYGYAMDLRPASPDDAEVRLQPEPRDQTGSALGWAFLRPAWLLVERGGGGVRIRDADGNWHDGGHVLQPFDSMLSEFADPERAPELLTLRERIRSWRLYDHLRTDTDAPACTVDAETTRVAGAERAGDEPAPGSAAGLGESRRHRAKDTQVIAVTHSRSFGQTAIADQGPLEEQPWKLPTR
jgi:predicted ATPase